MTPNLKSFLEFHGWKLCAENTWERRSNPIDNICDTFQYYPNTKDDYSYHLQYFKFIDDEYYSHDEYFNSEKEIYDYEYLFL